MMVSGLDNFTEAKASKMQFITENGLITNGSLEFWIDPLDNDTANIVLSSIGSDYGRVIYACPTLKDAEIRYTGASFTKPASLREIVFALTRSISWHVCGSGELK